MQTIYVFHLPRNCFIHVLLSCRKRYHRCDKEALNITGRQKSPGRPNNPIDRKSGDNADRTAYKGSTSSNTSLLKRRVIYFILAVCITLSKTSLATTETEINSQTLNDPGKYIGIILVINTKWEGFSNTY